MGLDIGVVKIDYLDRPSGAAYRFAWHLAGEWDDETWEVYSSAKRVCRIRPRPSHQPSRGIHSL